jgi:periplasmic copper chaperone A
MFPRAAIGLILLGLTLSPPSAHEITTGSITVIHPFARATPPGATSGGGYMAIQNSAAEDDRLIAVEPAADVAKRVTLHQTMLDGGVSKMLPLDGIDLPAGQQIVIGEGGTHLMFEDLTAPFGEGELLGATLIFEHAGEIEITFEVEPFSADPVEVIHSHTSH